MILLYSLVFILLYSPFSYCAESKEVKAVVAQREAEQKRPKTLPERLEQFSNTFFGSLERTLTDQDDRDFIEALRKHFGQEMEKAGIDIPRYAKEMFSKKSFNKFVIYNAPLMGKIRSFRDKWIKDLQRPLQEKDRDALRATLLNEFGSAIPEMLRDLVIASVEPKQTELLPIELLPADVQEDILSFKRKGAWFWDLFLIKAIAFISRSPDSPDFRYTMARDGSRVVGADGKRLLVYSYQNDQWNIAAQNDIPCDVPHLNDNGTVLICSFLEAERLTICVRADNKWRQVQVIPAGFRSMSNDASVIIDKNNNVYIRNENNWVLKHRAGPKEFARVSNNGNLLVVARKIVIKEPYVYHTTFYTRANDEYVSMYSTEIPYPLGRIAPYIVLNNDGSQCLFSPDNLGHIAHLMIRQGDTWPIVENIRGDYFAFSQQGDVLLGYQKVAYGDISFQLYLYKQNKWQQIQTGNLSGDDLAISMSADGSIITTNTKQVLIRSAELLWENKTTPTFFNQVSADGFTLLGYDGLYSIPLEARTLRPKQLELIEQLYMQHAELKKAEDVATEELRKKHPKARAAHQRTMMLSGEDAQEFFGLPVPIQSVLKSRLRVITEQDSTIRFRTLSPHLTMAEKEEYNKLAIVDRTAWLTQKEEEVKKRLAATQSGK